MIAFFIKLSYKRFVNSPLLENEIKVSFIAMFANETKTRNRMEKIKRPFVKPTIPPKIRFPALRPQIFVNLLTKSLIIFKIKAKKTNKIKNTKIFTNKLFTLGAKICPAVNAPSKLKSGKSFESKNCHTNEKFVCPRTASNSEMFSNVPGTRLFNKFDIEFVKRFQSE